MSSPISPKPSEPPSRESLENASSSATSTGSMPGRTVSPSPSGGSHLTSFVAKVFGSSSGSESAPASSSAVKTAHGESSDACAKAIEELLPLVWRARSADDPQIAKWCSDYDALFTREAFDSLPPYLMIKLAFKAIKRPVFSKIIKNMPIEIQQFFSTKKIIDLNPTNVIREVRNLFPEKDAKNKSLFIAMIANWLNDYVVLPYPGGVPESPDSYDGTRFPPTINEILRAGLTAQELMEVAPYLEEVTIKHYPSFNDSCFSVEQFIQQCSNVKTLAIEGQQIKSLPRISSTCKAFSCDKCDLDSLPELPNVEKIILSRVKLKSINASWTKCKEFSIVDCSGVESIDVDLQNCTSFGCSRMSNLKAVRGNFTQCYYYSNFDCPQQETLPAELPKCVTLSIRKLPMITEMPVVPSTTIIRKSN